jgi:formin 2
VSITEFLPTDDEVLLLKRFVATNSGDISRLGVTDMFMLRMVDVKDCAARFRSLAVQKRFPIAVSDILNKLAIIERACDDVKASVRLRKLLSVVLMLGNKLNAGTVEVSGFTLDSLLKLRDAKV